MPDAKKRVIKGLDTLTDDLRDLIRKQYPNGYEGSITRISNAKKEPIFVFPIETVDAIILVKVPATKNSEGEYDVASTPEEEFDNTENDDYNDDNNNYNEDGDYEESGKTGRRGEASYDPDFDA